MAISVHKLITCLHLPEFGRDNTRIVADYARQEDARVESEQELTEWIDHCFDIERIDNIPEYDHEDYARAMAEADRIMELCRKRGFGISVRHGSNFPRQLLSVKVDGKESAPPLIYYKGDIERVCAMPGIAIIGSRRTTREGMADGQHFAAFAAREGMNVISGLAVGADTAAHTGALAARGTTTAILAYGLNRESPDNAALQQRIARQGGLLLTEYAPNVPRGYTTLVERDRLQAALADAVVLVQSNVKRGGSMHAVNTAIESGKPVFAIDYRHTHLADDDLTQQNRMLIEQGRATALTHDNIKIITQITHRHY